MLFSCWWQLFLLRSLGAAVSGHSSQSSQTDDVWPSVSGVSRLSTHTLLHDSHSHWSVNASVQAWWLLYIAFLLFQVVVLYRTCCPCLTTWPLSFPLLSRGARENTTTSWPSPVCPVDTLLYYCYSYCRVSGHNHVWIIDNSLCTVLAWLTCMKIKCTNYSLLANYAVCHGIGDVKIILLRLWFTVNLEIFVVKILS